jgi:hypothetical protein
MDCPQSPGSDEVAIIDIHLLALASQRASSGHWRPERHYLSSKAAFSNLQPLSGPASVSTTIWQHATVVSANAPKQFSAAAGNLDLLVVCSQVPSRWSIRCHP